MKNVATLCHVYNTIYYSTFVYIYVTTSTHAWNPQSCQSCPDDTILHSIRKKTHIESAMRLAAEQQKD